MHVCINFKKVINIFFFLVTILYPTNPFSTSALYIPINKNCTDFNVWLMGWSDLVTMIVFCKLWAIILYQVFHATSQKY